MARNQVSLVLRTITDGKRRYHPVIYSASGQLKPS
jgi:hypothetical protein